MCGVKAPKTPTKTPCQKGTFVARQFEVERSYRQRSMDGTLPDYILGLTNVWLHSAIPCKI